MIYVILLLVLGFGLGAWRGAPYVPILHRQAEDLLDLSELQPGQTLIDLGSGDGRLLKAAAKRGIRGVGYEINPLLWIISNIYLWPERRIAKVRLADFWQVRLPKSDGISIFLIERYMTKLDEKLNSEIDSPTVVVSYVFTIPGQTPEASTKNSYRYRYPN